MSLVTRLAEPLSESMHPQAVAHPSASVETTATTMIIKTEAEEEASKIKQLAPKQVQLVADQQLVEESPVL